MESEKEIIKRLQNENDLLKKEQYSFQQNYEMFKALVRSAVGDIGQDFFNHIVFSLSEWLKVDCVIVGLKSDENTVECFPIYLDGKIIHGHKYELSGTPCDLTTKKGYCLYTENVKSFFPTSKDLFEMNMEGYVGIALYNKNGKPNGILCAMSHKKLTLPPMADELLHIVAERVTAEIERIKANKALEISEAKLKSAVASKDRLFSIIAHDLKNPFNSLIGFSKLLLDHIHRNKFDRVEQYVSIIHDVSVQTHTLLANLLEWSIVQTGNIRFDPNYFNLTDLFNEIIGYFRNVSEQKNITISSEAHDALEVYADINMITVILRNLVNNAIKYTGPGGSIRLMAIKDHNITTITVSDTGIGISPENIENLFRIETSFSTLGTQNEKGTGLGLILCKDLIEKHRGEMLVNSKEGSGTQFSFTIPANHSAN